MQRWFFLEDDENARLRRGQGDTTFDEKGASSMDVVTSYSTKMWLFRVRVPDLKPDETVCVAGNVAELGRWISEKCVQLEQEGETEVWSKKISIPDKQTVHYRYCVNVIIESGIQVVVRNWETNLEGRIIRDDGVSPTKNDEAEIYGCNEQFCHIDRGWINKETVVQLKLFNDPVLWRPRYANRNAFIKVTPLNLMRYNTSLPKNISEVFEDSLSADQDSLETPIYATTEVSSLCSSDGSFQPQGQFGKEFKSGDCLVFQCHVLFPANIAFLIDLYVYSSRVIDDEPPYHAGFTYLLPSVFQSSSTGSVILPVTSTKQRPLGQIDLEYLVIRPLNNFKCDMEVSFARYWKNSWRGLDVGHRGAGSSFKMEPKNCAEVRENTLASLKAAIQHGADCVEFDVQLSKDGVPVVYHDFHVCISMKRKKQLEDEDMLELPVKDLTLEQLRLLKVYHLTEGKSKNPRFFDDDLEEHQPFPTLQQVMEMLEPHVGLNIEVKWTMQMKDGSYELENPIDINYYVDTILEVVLKYAGSRKIIFSGFNPDICSMLRLKQNKYPVLFLTVGQTAKYQPYRDPRCMNIEMAIRQAEMMQLLGVNVHTEDLLRDPSQVKLATEAGLVIFCWGDDNADKATIKYLKELGLHGIIYDKIDQYSSKEVKESIFLIEARESQKDLIRLAAAGTESINPTPMKERILDVERARQNLDTISTATSLESLESKMSDLSNCNCYVNQ